MAKNYTKKTHVILLCLKGYIFYNKKSKIVFIIIKISKQKLDAQLLLLLKELEYLNS